MDACVDIGHTVAIYATRTPAIPGMVLLAELPDGNVELLHSLGDPAGWLYPP